MCVTHLMWRLCANCWSYQLRIILFHNSPKERFSLFNLRFVKPEISLTLAAVTCSLILTDSVVLIFDVTEVTSILLVCGVFHVICKLLQLWGSTSLTLSYIRSLRSIFTHMLHSVTFIHRITFLFIIFS
jgi:hypothetical protein